MKKFKISFSFFILIFLCIIFKNFLLLINYFSALAIHELSHFLVARSRGYKLTKLNLGMFGMSIDLDLPLDDKDNFWVNISGPLANLSICLICVSCYWLFPSSYYYLNSFCLANLTLAIFNLLPIYPLDGGKIFYKIFNNRSSYKYINFFMKFILVLLSLLFAYFNLFSSRFMFLLFAAFFAISNQSPKHSFAFYKTVNSKSIQKIELIKIDSNLKLYELLKLIKSKNYTIFYCENLKQKYFNQDDLISISLRYPLNSQIRDCNVFSCDSPFSSISNLEENSNQ